MPSSVNHFLGATSSSAFVAMRLIVVSSQLRGHLQTSPALTDRLFSNL